MLTASCPDSDPDPDRVGPRDRAPRDESRATRVLSSDPGEGGAPALIPGQGHRIGRFWVTDTLGAGGMGVVLEAYDEVLDRTVALKLLHRRGDHRQHARLEIEAKALARLSHPNVVQVYDIGQVDGTTFIAMELVEGDTLRRWSQATRSWRELVGAYIQAGSGLAAAHAEGIVHRDFKPANCIVGHDGRVRVLDFGLARSNASDSRRRTDSQMASSSSASRSRITRDGAVVGTLGFMAPEQLMGVGATHLSDQYAFCVSLYEALYGVLPFRGRTPIELIVNIQQGLRAQREPEHVAVPRRLRRLLRRGLSVEPSCRYPSMEALLHELRALVVPRRWRQASITMALGAALGASVWGVASAEPSRCADPEAVALELWSERDRDELESVVDRAFAARDPVGPRMMDQLDDYTREWAAVADQSCRATFVTHQYAESVFEHRMSCLARHRNRFDATVDSLLTAAGRGALPERSVLAFQLPRLEHCAQLTTAGEGVAPALDPTAQDRARSVRRTIDRAHTLRTAGDFDEGLVLARRARREALALGVPRLEAEALECVGRLEAESARTDQAVVTLADAVLEASALGDDSLTARAWLSMVFAMTMRRDLVAAEARVLAARAAVQRSADPYLDAWRLNNEAILRSELAQHERASHLFQDALELKSRLLGEQHVDVGIAWSNLGAHYLTRGEPEDALDALERARAIFGQTVGHAHPLMTYVDGGACQAYRATEDYEAAVESCLDVLARAEFSSLPSTLVASARATAVFALEHAGRHDEARRIAAQPTPLEAADPTTTWLRDWVMHDSLCASGTSELVALR